MNSSLHKGVLALSSVAVLLALGACGDAREVASTDPRVESASQVTGQANEISKEEKSDTAVMGAAPSSTTQPGADASPALSAKIDDTQIVAQLKTEFAADKDISAMAVDIDSKDGIVTLSGTVPNSDAKVRADQMAKAMKDVKQVNNKLEVKAG